MAAVSLSAILTCVLLLPQQGLLVEAFWGVSNGVLKSDHGYDFFFVGETLTLDCYKNTNFTGKPVFMYGEIHVNDALVETLNATHARMQRTVTGEDYSQTLYQCLDGTTLVATMTIRTDYPPQKATDMNMVWLNKETLFIGWTFGDTEYKFSSLDKIMSFTSEWSKNTSDASAWRLCVESSNTTCNISMYSDDYSKLTLRVNVTNKVRNVTESTVFPGYSVIDYAKPNPLLNFKAEAFNSTAVKLTWTRDWYKMIYKVTWYYSKKTGPVQKFEFTTDLTTDNSLVIADLHPNYAYVLEFQQKFATGSFSDAATTELQMPQDAPSAAPVITPGAYSIDRLRCSVVEEDTKAYIYYQEVVEEHQNGEIRNYTAEVITDSSISNVYVQPNPPRSLELGRVPCREGFEVAVYASTDVGRSPSSSLVVPAWNQDLYDEVDKLKLRIKINLDASITAEWTSPFSSGDSVSQLYLYYCTRSIANSHQCEHSIKAVTTDINKEQSPLPSAIADMKFGVALRSLEGKTTGIVFTECVYYPEEDPIFRPSGVHTLSRTDSIEVRWKGEDECNARRQIIILYYEVDVCTGLDNTGCTLHKTEDGNSFAYTLRGLQPDTEYSMKVRAVTSSTKAETPFSDPVVASLQQPVKSELDSGEIAGIVFAVLLSLLALGIFVFCWLRRNFKKAKAKFPASLDSLKKDFEEYDNPSLSPDSVFGDKGNLFDDKGSSFSKYIAKENSLQNHPRVSDDSGYSGNDSPLPVTIVPNAGLPPVFEETGPKRDTRPKGYTMVVGVSGSGDSPGRSGPLDTDSQPTAGSQGGPLGVQNQQTVGFVFSDNYCTHPPEPAAKDKAPRAQVHQSSTKLQAEVHQPSGKPKAETDRPSSKPKAENQQSSSTLEAENQKHATAEGESQVGNYVRFHVNDLATASTAQERKVQPLQKEPDDSAGSEGREEWHDAASPPNMVSPYLSHEAAASHMGVEIASRTDQVRSYITHSEAPNMSKPSGASDKPEEKPGEQKPVPSNPAYVTLDRLDQPCQPTEPAQRDLEEGDERPKAPGKTQQPVPSNPAYVALDRLAQPCQATEPAQRDLEEGDERPEAPGKTQQPVPSNPAYVTLDRLVQPCQATEPAQRDLEEGDERPEAPGKTQQPVPSNPAYVTLDRLVQPCQATEPAQRDLEEGDERPEAPGKTQQPVPSNPAYVTLDRLAQPCQPTEPAQRDLEEGDERPEAPGKTPLPSRMASGYVDVSTLGDGSIISPSLDPKEEAPVVRPQSQGISHQYVQLPQDAGRDFGVLSGKKSQDICPAQQYAFADLIQGQADPYIQLPQDSDPRAGDLPALKAKNLPASHPSGSGYISPLCLVSSLGPLSSLQPSATGEEACLNCTGEVDKEASEQTVKKGVGGREDLNAEIPTSSEPSQALSRAGNAYIPWKDVPKTALGIACGAQKAKPVISLSNRNGVGGDENLCFLRMDSGYNSPPLESGTVPKWTDSFSPDNKEGSPPLSYDSGIPSSSSDSRSSEEREEVIGSLDEDLQAQPELLHNSGTFRLLSNGYVTINDYPSTSC